MTLTQKNAHTGIRDHDVGARTRFENDASSTEIKTYSQYGRLLQSGFEGRSRIKTLAQGNVRSVSSNIGIVFLVVWLPSYCGSQLIKTFGF
jgi:hypothetical protein